jgi:hypothetical protein
MYHVLWTSSGYELLGYVSGETIPDQGENMDFSRRTLLKGLASFQCRGTKLKYTSTPPYVFMAWCLTKYAQGKFAVSNLLWFMHLLIIT